MGNFLRKRILLVQVNNTAYTLYFWNSNNPNSNAAVKTFSKRRIGIEKYESPDQENLFFERNSYKSLILYCDNLHLQIIKTT